MLLSIIIPIYNVKKYLPFTLENILKQKFDDYEVILVDDGSTDGSEEICNQYVEKNSKVCVIHQKNAGVSIARNIGVACAKGRYVGFVDSDDLIEPNMFKILVEIAEQERADIVQCRHNRIEKIEKVIYSGYKREIDGCTFVREMFNYQSNEYTNQVALWSKIYRRELFSDIIFPKGRTYEDEQETYKICLKAKKIIQIPDELYHYIKRENSIITGISAKKMLDKQLALMDRLDYLPQRLPELKEKCARSFLLYSENIMCKLYKNGEIDILELVINNLLGKKQILKEYLNKYEKIYLLLLPYTIGKKLVLENQFVPIQKIIAKIKGLK